MPLLRKLIKVGHSRAVIIPSDWLKNHELETGQKLHAILMEVDNVITIAPKPEKEEEEAPQGGQAVKSPAS